MITVQMGGERTQQISWCMWRALV